MKDERKWILINEFAALKSKMHSILSENNKEFNAAKGVNITTECNKYKEILFKKITRYKIKRI